MNNKEFYELDMTFYSVYGAKRLLEKLNEISNNNQFPIKISINGIQTLIDNEKELAIYINSFYVGVNVGLSSLKTTNL